MAIKVLINGFGRIGRLAFRRMFDSHDFEIVGINGRSPASVHAHCLKYDTVFHRYKYASSTFADDEKGIITVNGKEILVFQENDARNLKLGELEIDVVLECSGIYKSADKAQAFLDAGAKKVVISAPADGKCPTIVYNVNHKTLTPEDKVISAASCTTNCLAPMAKALNELVPIKSGIMCSIHAYTSAQNLLDGHHKKNDLRKARAAATNIIPNSTGAAKAIGLVIPELQGKLTGGAQRVPTPDGSTTLLMAVVDGEVTVDQINAHMKDSVNETYGYNEDQIVSGDIIGMEYGSLFDATQTICMPMDNGMTMVQVVAWYDNEFSYTCQMIRTMKYFAQI